MLFGYGRRRSGASTRITLRPGKPTQTACSKAYNSKFRGA